jgi:ribonuclease HII
MHKVNRKVIVGLDEAGRGPWAGPLVAAAVILRKGFTHRLLKDSKRLTSAQREEMYALLIQKTIWGIGIVSNEEIDHFGLQESNEKAFRRALTNLHHTVTHILVDGRERFNLPGQTQAIIGGDGLIPCISAASILAKVTRDRIMIEYAKRYPFYAFEEHKGYGTEKHRTHLARQGITPLHRKSFKPIQSYL